MKPITEDLRRWFKEKWVDVSKKNSSGEHPPCGRSKSSKRGYPKCRPSVRVSSDTPETSGEMTDSEKKAATRQKRRAETKKRKGKLPHMTSHKDLEEQLLFESKNAPTNPELWSRAKALARKKFKVYPSAYANGWAAKWYKGKGGGWKSISENWTEYDIKPGETSQSHFDPNNENFNIKKYMRLLRKKLGIQEKLPGETD